MSNVAGLAVPSHVPPEVVVDFDIFDPPGGSEDPQGAWLRLRQGPDIQWTPRNAGHWILTRAEDIKYFWQHPDPFSSLSVDIPPQSKPSRMLPLEADPPEHAVYRAVVNVFFTPKVIQPLEQEARQLTRSLIDGFYARGECEFIADYSAQLPIRLFMHMTDLPFADRDMLRGWADDAVRGKTLEPRLQAYRSIEGYLQRIIAARRAEPGDDLFSRVIRSNIAGRPLTDEEMLSFCTAILFGGLDTVVSSLGFIAHFLATSERHRKQLIEQPALMQNAINEMLRRYSVTTNARLVAHDVVYKGLQFKKGDRVSLGTPLHGLDEQKFANPLEVDFERKLGGDIATFGFGAHRCPGSYLARTEIKVFLEEWLARIPNYTIKPGDKAVFNAGRINSVQYLPLAWPVG